MVALGAAPPDANEARFSSYTRLLLEEIQHTPTQNQRGLETIFFGGGTPSLLPPQLLEQLLNGLQDQFGIAADAEISIEADPGTFTADSLATYMRSGVNRFSLGVQVQDLHRSPAQRPSDAGQCLHLALSATASGLELLTSLQAHA